MTITEQKAFLQTYTGKAQAPAHPAQDWADAVKELHFEAQTAPVEFANAYGVYERLTITYEGRTVTARVIRPASTGQHPLLLMYHDLNRGVRGWHHMTRFWRWALVRWRWRPNLTRAIGWLTPRRQSSAPGIRTRWPWPRPRWRCPGWTRNGCMLLERASAADWHC